MHEGSTVEGKVVVNDWLDSTWKGAVSAARHGLGSSPAERAMRLINARAGKSPVAYFAPGELARLIGIPESDAHEAIEALINAHQLGAESHPGCQVVLANLPAYLEPTEPTPIPKAHRIEVVPNRRTGSWTSRLVPITEENDE